MSQSHTADQPMEETQNIYLQNWYWHYILYNKTRTKHKPDPQTMGVKINLQQYNYTLEGTVFIHIRNKGEIDTVKHV